MRKDDSQNRTHCRAKDRVFHQDGAWWFSTRDENSGPFASEEGAQASLVKYVEQLRGDINLDKLSEFDEG